MEKRYQVFVSSTFKDLQSERQEIMHALLELDCIPSGMELFPAANETQWDLIKRVIDDCDYYLLVLAGRYGSLGPEGVGYTEMEYRYALETRKPCIAFLHRNPGKIAADFSESTAEGKDKLQSFRALAEQKLCKHWDTAQELGSVVSRSLVQLIKQSPATGWVRANALGDPMEMLTLRARVQELQLELNRLNASGPKGAETLAQGDDLFTIRTFYTITVGSIEYAQRLSQCKMSWNAIFSKVAPLLMDACNDRRLKDSITELAFQLNRKDVNNDIAKSEWPAGAPTKYSIYSEDFHTIRVQLRALGLIRRRINNEWELTEYGDESMTRLRAIHRKELST